MYSESYWKIFYIYKNYPPYEIVFNSHLPYMYRFNIGRM